MKILPINQRHVATNRSGFTLVELMIATTVFSMVLLLCSYGLIEVGRHYQKGITITRTQEAARTITEEFSDSVQFGGGEYVSLTSVGDVHGFCMGSKRFSYILDRQLDTSIDAPSGDRVPRVIYVDELTDDASCVSGTQPQNLLNGGNGRELLGERMQLLDLDISRIGADEDKLWKIQVKIASGDDGVLEGTSENCKNGAQSSHYCAVSELETIAQKRK